MKHRSTNSPITCSALCLAILVSTAMLSGCKEEQAAAVQVKVPDSQVPASQTTPAPKDDDSDADASKFVRPENPLDAPEQIGAPEPKSRPRSTIRKGGVRDITFDDIEFEMEPDADYLPEMLTDEIRELDGKKVILRGFMEASTIFQRVGIKEFVLVRDNQICCFGPGAKIYHNVWINMEGDASAKFPGLQPLQVEGEFSIRPWKNPGDGKVYSVFHIQATKAKK